MLGTEPDTHSVTTTPSRAHNGLGRRLYLGAVIVGGAAVLVWSVADVIARPPGALFLVLAAFTAASSAAAFRMPGFPVTFSLSDTFTVLAALLFGPAAGSLLVALDAVVLSSRLKISTPSAERVALNITSVAVAMWLAAELFLVVVGREPLTAGSVSFGRTAGALAVFAITYFLLNTWLVAGAVAIGRESSFYDVWREHFFPLWVTHVGGTFAASLLFLPMATGLASMRMVTIGLPLLLLVALLLVGAERLRQQSAKFAALRSYAAALRSTADAVMLTDVDDRVTFLNPRAERLTGWTDAQARGRDAGDVLRLEPIAHDDIEVASLAEPSDDHASREYMLIRQDGSRRPIEQSHAHIRDADDEIEGAIRTFRDIGQRKAVEAERQTLLRRQEEARAAADAANRAKDEFLATLCHELRTPMAAILGWIHLLKSGRMTHERTEQALQSLERGARAQAVVLNDLLDVSRIIRGTLRLDVRRMDLAAVLHESVETLQSAADAKGVEMVVDVAADVSMMEGDPDRLRQVFWNLVSNAVKFTPAAGSIRIEARRQGDVLRVVVSDTGCGIESTFLPFVFERFRQGDQSAARTHGGLGLGLAIVREFVELHAGSVTVTSAGPRRGAQFTVELPAVLRRRHSDTVSAAT